MKAVIFCLALVLGAHITWGQTSYTEGELFVADRGTFSNGSDGAVRRYSHNGQLRGTIAVGGSGPIRGMTFDQNGSFYVARGDSIWRHQAPSYAPDAQAFATGVKAQDVAFNRSTGNIWTSWGTTAANAKIIEYTTAGVVAQTLTNALLVHPRSIAFDLTNQFLFIANGSGANVVRLNTANNAFATYATLSTGAGTGVQGFNAIGIGVDTNGAVLVVGDYGFNPSIIRLTGNLGSVTPQIYLAYGAATNGFKAPAGLTFDSFGNVYFACRNQNSATEGVYGFSATSPIPVIAPLVGTEHINPIDVAFKPEPLTVTITSSDGVDSAGIAVVNAGVTQPQLTITVTAPNFAGRTYGILMSIAPAPYAAVALSGQPTLPITSVGVPLSLTEPRKMPLAADDVFAQSLNAAANVSGLLVFSCGNPPPPACILFPSIPGILGNFSGVTSPTGVGVATIIFPTLPLMSVGQNIYLTVAAAVVDGTAPLGIGAMSAVPTCIHVRRL